MSVNIVLAVSPTPTNRTTATHRIVIRSPLLVTAILTPAFHLPPPTHPNPQSPTRNRLPRPSSKNAKTKVLLRRANTCKALESYTQHKLPGVKAFDVPKDAARMLKRDPEEGIPYAIHKRHADFHSPRHSPGTWLSFSGARPSVVQDILRHSDIRLTLGRYGHLFDHEARDAIEAPPHREQALATATGTDRQSADSSSAPRGGNGRISVRKRAQNAPIPGNIAQIRSGPKSALEHQEPRFQTENGEGGIRTRGRGVYPYDGLANRCPADISPASASLTNTGPKRLARRLARIVQEHPDLRELIERWPRLSADLGAAILRMVETLSSTDSERTHHGDGNRV